MVNIKAFSFFILLSGIASAQPSSIDQLIKTGLESNHSLKQHQIQLDKANAALHEARGLFLPSISFQAEYTYAQGGRKLNFPIGDLLNPVYGTLNQLTASNAFPQVENVDIQFLPNNFHDTRLRSSLPIVNAEIWYLNKIRQEAIQGQQAELMVYKRNVVRDIKSAYANYLKTLQAISIYQSGVDLLEKNLKLTQALVKQDMALPAAVFQVKAELSATQSKLESMNNDSRNAAAYLNFLLNRDLATEIPNDTLWLKTAGNQPSFNSFATQREEILQLQSGLKQTESLLSMKKAYYIPTLGTFFDAGYQGFGYKMNSDQRYYLGGFQLKWNLFAGRQNTWKVKQANSDVLLLNDRISEAESQLRLHLTTSQNALASALKQLESSKEALTFARESYRLTAIRYENGQAIPLELTQALQQLTQAQLTLAIQQSEVRMREAELERAAASFTF